MAVQGWRRLVSVGLSTVVVGGLAVMGGLSPATAAPATLDSVTESQRKATAQAQPKTQAAARTSAKEARRVGRVKTPKLRWYSCVGAEHAQCATAKLPRDYDRPHGAKVEVAVVRLRATDQKNKIGSLFINPGGPGGSGTQFVAAAGSYLSPALLRRFDIVGFDPRGTNFSDQVTCFKGPRQQSPVFEDLFSTPFPVTKAEEKKTVRGSKALGKACSTTGKPLSASMSTAEVARDMEVLRRSVGDKKLNYLGFSYGSFLGQVYANMFPDRFRSLAIDGILDPVAWAGTRKTKNIPVTDRIRSADGAGKALREILVRCGRAGADRCQLAAGGNPVADYDRLAQRLKKKPAVIFDEETGESISISYAFFISLTQAFLYDPQGSALVDFFTSALLELTQPAAAGTLSASRRASAVEEVQSGVARAERLASAQRGSFGFPYDNSFEAFASVLCTDSRNPASASSWPRYADAAERRVKYFGRLEAWGSSSCASKTWKAKDEDAYRGPFTKRTKAPVLVVGSLWDPATSYAGARKAASLLPNSRLLTSDNWGHTAYRTSQCATTSIDQYLLTVALPAAGKRCVGDVQPFTETIEEEAFAVAAQQASPIVPLVPRVPALKR